MSAFAGRRNNDPLEVNLWRIAVHDDPVNSAAAARGACDQSLASVARAGTAAYAEACRLVVAHGKTSPAWLHRQIGGSYNRAAGHVEQMQRDGLVSAPDHVGRRVLLSQQT
ncbi:DNA translocase FtsK [Sphingomonas sp.]|uniref:DNA translocase FtsK n=1 Tax=Sphingomonas sp. TaxID=28214 RepID=UPI0039C8EA2B